MKELVKIIIFMVTLLICAASQAQTYEWQKSPLPNEILLDKINESISAGYKREQRREGVNSNGQLTGNYTDWKEYSSYFKEYDIEYLYKIVKDRAEKKYKNYAQDVINIRNLKCSSRIEVTKTDYKNSPMFPEQYRTLDKYYNCTCILTLKDINILAMEQALEGIRGGSRFALDNISVSGDMDKDDYKDKIVDILLDKDYKVVAKEYLEKLYAEQQTQKKGIYNDKTIAIENNFTAIGYYISVKASRNSVRVQIVNVSIGEYDGYAVVNYNNQSNTVSDDKILQATQKALRNVPEGSRLAIDNVSVSSGDKEYYKDKCIAIMINKGYKVVAKEYLEKLYDEQQQQQSGIYNDNTTVQENNFSAVGYFVNVKLTESSIRVQVVNVSTGEYEGNAVITF